MSSYKLYQILSILLVSSFIFSNCVDGTDVCLSLDGNNLNYVSSEDIAGFQFDHDGCAVNAGGGDAVANGFTVTASSGVVLAFSFTGSVIPAGAGTLVDLGSADCTEESLSLFVFADPAGDPLIVNFSQVATGCMDETACNYDADAEEDDGSCEYEVDCAGECGGSAMEDCAGECGGSAMEDCAGECGGSAMEDCAGQCGGSAMEDCTGECDGSAVEDACGERGGDATDPTTCVEEGYSLSIGEVTDTTLEIIMNNETEVAGFQFVVTGVNVTGAVGGSAGDAEFTVSTGLSGMVLGFSLTGATISASNGVLTVVSFDSMDGSVCIADAILSNIAGEGLDVEIGDCYCGLAIDCDGECGGSAVVDECGECGGDGPDENFDCDGNCIVDIDCSDICGGSAELDDCGVCEGGNIDMDCSGTCFGDAEEDECGICEGDGSMCTVSMSISLDDSTGNMLVHMSNAMDVAGFQFNISNIIINSVSGGSAEEAGFMVSGANGNAIGFSLTGAVIPPGEGVLVEIDYTALWDEACLNSVVLSDALGGSIDWMVGDCIALDFVVVDGCMDSDACNYNSDANSDDGSCTYPEGNYDCDGNCTVDTDCAGECGGDLAFDECGECGGDNSTCTGCMDDTALNYDDEATLPCDDCCEYPTDVEMGVVHVSTSGDIEIEMTNINEVAGFQFLLTSTCDVDIASGYGGSAEDAGFMVSTSEGGIVLGFSLTGSTIPVGSGTLLFLDATFECESGSFGLEDVIISDISGSSMSVNVYDDYEYTQGCQDEEAANYGEEGDCLYNSYYSIEINETGASHLIVFIDTIEGLDIGDEIGIFDASGVTQTFEPGEAVEYGEVLVGVGVWDGLANFEGTVTSASTIMSQDLSEFGGPILNGAVDGNDIVVKIYDASEGIEYDTERTFELGGQFGDIFTVINGITLSGAPNIGDPCDFNEDGTADDGVIDCSLNCGLASFLGDGFCDDGAPYNFQCEELNWDEGDCEELSNDSITPSEFSLSQNYPNPFNPQTMIQFSVPSLSNVSINIYDLNGKLVDVVAQGVYSKGTHVVVWDGMTLNRELVSSGVYLYKLITPSATLTKQLTIIR